MLSLYLPVGIMVSLGLLTILSLSFHLFLFQLLWLSVGIAITILFSFFIDWRSVLNYRWVIPGLYCISIALLLYVRIAGPVIRNARSWIVIGPFSFQPVELAKITLILLCASYFSRRHMGIAHWKNILTSFIFFIIPAVLVAMQPNLGSALVLFGIWFGYLLLSGLPMSRVVILLSVFIAAGFVMWSHFLQPYQRARIIGVLYPDQYALGINYNTQQSKIAIGSGGFWGKGYGQGPQAQLGFLPVPESDFILATMIEQWGMFSGLIVFGAFLYFVLQILKIGLIARSNFEKFFCLGTALVFIFQFFLNTGSELGLLPVIGVTFPFISYGGSSLISNLFLVAIVGSIKRTKWL